MGSELMATVPLFQGLSPEVLAQLAAAMKPRRLPAGQILFLKGDAGDHLYVIRSGEVKLVLSMDDGQEAILDVLREGDYLGEMSLFDEQPRSADAVTTQPTALLTLHRDDFRALNRRHPEMAFPIYRTLSQRLRRTTELLEESRFLDLGTRIARVLLRLARDFGKETAAGTQIDRPISQQELAGMVGGTRPRVNEQLQRLRRQNLIRYEQQRFTILRPDALAQRAG